MKKILALLISVLSLWGCASADNCNCVCNETTDENYMYSAYKDGKLVFSFNYAEGNVSGTYSWNDSFVEYDEDGNIVGMECTYATNKDGYGAFFRLEKDDIDNLLNQNKGYAISCDYVNKKIAEFYKSNGIDINTEEGYEKISKSVDIKKEIMQLL